MCNIIHVLPFGLLILSVASINYRKTGGYEASKSMQDADCIANLCNSTKNYPYAKIKKLLQDSPQFYVYFGNVVDKVRRSSDNSQYSYCESDNSLFYPKRGLNLNNEWKTIVNVDQLQQDLMIKRCQKGSCSSAESGAVCVQKFSHERMLVLNTNETISTDKFSVPTDCFCK